jgi:hypothetical protein
VEAKRDCLAKAETAAGVVVVVSAEAVLLVLVVGAGTGYC